MIELIQMLLKNSGAEQMTLTIKPEGENVTVIAHTQLGALPVGADEKVMAARNALQAPLVASGFVAEVDSDFGNLIMQYAESFESAAKAVSNIESVKASHTKAKSGQVADKPKSEPAKTTAVNVNSKPVEQESVPAPVSVSAPPASASVDDDDLFEDCL